MKALNVENLHLIQGGGVVKGACQGLVAGGGILSGLYGLGNFGVIAAIPGVGQAAAIVGMGAAVTCAAAYWFDF